MGLKTADQLCSSAATPAAVSVSSPSHGILHMYCLMVTFATTSDFEISPAAYAPLRGHSSCSESRDDTSEPSHDQDRSRAVSASSDLASRAVPLSEVGTAAAGICKATRRQHQSLQLSHVSIEHKMGSFWPVNDGSCRLTTGLC